MLRGTFRRANKRLLLHSRQTPVSSEQRPQRATHQRIAIAAQVLFVHRVLVGDRRGNDPELTPNRFKSCFGIEDKNSLDLFRGISEPKSRPPGRR